jgi:hypothetical protein
MEPPVFPPAPATAAPGLGTAEKSTNIALGQSLGTRN